MEKAYISLVLGKHENTSSRTCPKRNEDECPWLRHRNLQNWQHPRWVLHRQSPAMETNRLDATEY